MKKVLFAIAIIGLIFYLKSDFSQLPGTSFIESIKEYVPHVLPKLPSESEIVQFLQGKIRTTFHAFQFGDATSTGALIIPYDAKSLLDPLQKIARQVITPQPVIPQPTEQSRAQATTSLTRLGVILRTNTERILQNLLALRENSVLDAAALARANDLFARQYFAHIAPTGEGVSSVATYLGYNYAIVGENLAQGRFDDDKALVDAWMASRGHRENILNPRYQEIGVAVEKGIFKGEETWIGVQVFALPLSACPAPEINLHATIDAKQKLLTGLESQATALKQQIDSMDQHDSAYQEKVDAYNALVPQINLLITELDVLIKKYNEEVRALNGCIS